MLKQRAKIEYSSEIFKISANIYFHKSEVLHRLVGFAFFNPTILAEAGLPIHGVALIYR